MAPAAAAAPIGADVERGGGTAAAAAPLLDRQASGDAPSEACSHTHFSHRAPWLRALVLGANDGLVSVASLMLGVGAGSDNLRAMQLSGLAGLVGGALSMACGEYISVSSQRDVEEADVEKERAEQRKGPEAQRRELEELVSIYVRRGLSPALARQVAEELTAHDVIAAHARDELGIDLSELANPGQAAVTSALAFSLGAAVPLLAGGFIASSQLRVAAVAAASTLGLLLLGVLGAVLGDAKVVRGALRVLFGGVLAMSVTYGAGMAFGVSIS